MRTVYGIYIFTIVHMYMDVSKNRGTPKSSILIGFSIINHPFWDTPIFGNTHIDVYGLSTIVVPQFCSCSLCPLGVAHSLIELFLGFVEVWGKKEKENVQKDS